MNHRQPARGSDGASRRQVADVGRRRSRRGVAVLLVLGLLTIALATSYALTRSQFQAFQIQQNSQRKGDARQAAATGISAALRKLHQSDWLGVDTTLTGQLSADERFEVTFTTGDATLTPTHPEYAKFAYRLTVESTGFARDLSNPGAPALHTMSVVVELSPRKLSSEPSGWSVVQPYTVYQWQTATSSRFIVSPRSRVEGDVRIQRALQLCAGAPLDASARERWLGELHARQLQGNRDERPFEGRIDLSFLTTSAATRQLLTSQLGLTINDTPVDNLANWSHPGVVTNYRLYPGGKTYSVPLVGSAVSATTLGPDPQTNPLGVFASSGSVELRDDAKIRGTLIIGNSDLRIVGQRVEISAVDLPSVVGGPALVRLPAAIVQDDVRVVDGAAGALKGFVAVWDEFELGSAPQYNTQLAFEGRLLCKELLIPPRLEWQREQTWWTEQFAAFKDQEAEGVPFFTEWLEAVHSLPAQPILTIKPESGAVTYHWQDWSRPVFVPHDDDEGLRWEIIRWSNL